MINITAPNAEEFAKIEKALKALPEEVSNQIETAKKSILGIDCTIRIAYGTSNKISLPSPVEQIITHETEDQAICGDFRFIIPKEGNPKIHYVLTPMPKR